jgi:predicted GNAT family N-acyltransferase
MASERTSYREMERGEEAPVCSLARSVFAEAVAPDLGREGVEEFHRYADPAALEARLAEDHLVLVAESGGELVGLVELRHRRHVSMLFVGSRHRGGGIGSELLRRALGFCLPGPVTVHAAPDAVEFYARYGFRATAGELLVNGLRFVPMATPAEP